MRYSRLMFEKYNKKAFIGKIPQTGCLMELEPNNWITNSWYVRADYESNIIRGLCRFLRPGMVCLDIGANEGLFTLLMGKRVGVRGGVYSFEPTASTFQRLQTNIKLNTMHNITAENVAVMAKAGSVEFHIGPLELCVYNSIAKVTHPGATGGEFVRVNVPAISIDEYCVDHNINRVDCVKIDVEGAEFSVLKGMRNVLEANREIVVLIEFCQTTAESCESSLEEMTEWIAALGFRLFSINVDGCLRHINGSVPKGGEMLWAERSSPSIPNSPGFS